MQRTILSIFAIIFSIASYAEIEPNNTYQQASFFYYNTYTDSGAVSSVTDVDWFYISFNGFGNLSVTLKSDKGVNINFELYNSDGTTLLASSHTNDVDSIVLENLYNTSRYYIKIYGYTAGKTNAYHVSYDTSSFQPTDREPDDNYLTKADRLVLETTKYGHINYTQGSEKDTVDWFRFYGAGDGTIRVHVVPPPGLSLGIKFFDQDKVRLSTHIVTREDTIAQAGLGSRSAHRAYYIKVTPANENDTAKGGYNLTAWFITYSGDENGSRAFLLPVGSTVEGHLNYHYSRDSIDWYYLNTTVAGDLNFNVAPEQNKEVSMAVFAGDKKTLIQSSGTSISDTLNVYGLSAGKYYIRLKSPTPDTYTNYTITANVSTYKTPNDAEPNNYFSQAPTLPANNFTNGLINFYENYKRDSVDLWKVNYSGANGFMRLNFNLERPINDHSKPLLVEVYQEDTSTLVYRDSFTASKELHLTNLPPQWYYIKLTGKQGQACAYTFTDSFTQKRVQLHVLDKTTVVDCLDNNYITAKCVGSNPPYTLEEYYFNDFVSTKIFTDSREHKLSNKQQGIYMFRAYGAGATEPAVDTVIVYLLPTILYTTSYNITSTSATVQWSNQICGKYFSIRYRPKNTTNWTTFQTIGNTFFYNFANLTSSTKYEWQVASGDSANGVSGIGAYSALDSFTTANSFGSIVQSGNFSSKNLNNNIIIYPNPVQTKFIIQYNAPQKIATVFLRLKNVNGVTVWSKNNIASTAVNGSIVYVDNIPSGIYVLNIHDQNNNLIATKKIIVSR